MSLVAPGRFCIRPPRTRIGSRCITVELEWIAYDLPFECAPCEHVFCRVLNATKNTKLHFSGSLGIEDRISRATCEGTDHRLSKAWAECVSPQYSNTANQVILGRPSPRGMYYIS